jgi:hypothetical protein
METQIVKIRFNTKANEDNKLPYWRVIVNDVEYLTNDIEIHTKSWTTKDWIDDDIGYKWHITCNANQIIFFDNSIEIY